MFQTFIEEVTQVKDKITIKVKFIDINNTLYKDYRYAHEVDINTRFDNEALELLDKLNGSEESEEALNELKQMQY